MAIITISRGSFSHGKEIAEKVAEILGYECVSREILLEASQYFKVSEKKLIESIHDAPSIFDRITTAGRNTSPISVQLSLITLKETMWSIMAMQDTC